MCDNLGIPDKVEKVKVFLFSDNADVSNVAFFDISGIMEWINNDEHNQEDEYEYTIRVIWMTEDEVENLPEADF